MESKSWPCQRVGCEAADLALAKQAGFYSQGIPSEVWQSATSPFPVSGNPSGHSAHLLAHAVYVLPSRLQHELVALSGKLNLYSISQLPPISMSHLPDPSQAPHFPSHWIRFIFFNIPDLEYDKL